MIWFTADEHYFHENIIKYCNRPFSNVTEMNETIIARNNEVVKLGDIVYHLGDFAWRDAWRIFDRLHGRHYLIKGNHDKRIKTDANRLFLGLWDNLMVKSEGKQIFLSHYAHRVWPSSHKGIPHLYGHSHGKLEPWGRSFDVGVDCNDFRPINLDDIWDRVMKLSQVKV